MLMVSLNLMHFIKPLIQYAEIAASTTCDGLIMVNTCVTASTFYHLKFAIEPSQT